MIRSIKYEEREITYEFSRKKIKNLNARLRRDGSLAVSAPLWCTDEQVEAFLLACLPRLLRARERHLEKKKTPVQLEDGASMSLLGRPIVLRLARGNKRRAAEQGNELWLTVRQSDPPGAYQAVLDTYLLTLAKEKLTALYRQTYHRFFEKSFPCPALRFRRMVSRFGSCNCTGGIITLNTYLLYAEPRAVEYVILHELVHMLHPNHSARFYAAVSRCMPDYQARAASLKTVSLPGCP